MKAIRVYEYGSPEVLRLEDIADLVAGEGEGEGEVLIDVAGAGVNPIDWKILSGAMKAFIPLPLPFTSGVEVAGTVIALGQGVTEFSIGDEVFGFINIVGGYATKDVEAYPLSEAKVAIEKSLGRHLRGRLVLDTTR
jgi:NADPH:quinone reductase-like Zn-dependent oxidoreductase